MVETSATDIGTNIGPHDVLLGRGGATNNHTGNRHFRTIVSEHQSEYLKARKKEKIHIARRIVSIIQGKGGRFMKRTKDDGWVAVPDKRAQEKTSQALREGLDVRNHTVRPSKQIKEVRQTTASPTTNSPNTTTIATPHSPKAVVSAAGQLVGLQTNNNNKIQHLYLPDTTTTTLQQQRSVLSLYQPPASVSSKEVKQECAV